MPENTIPAFAAAMALGADKIEFDVRLTKDCELVVSHDGRLERISNGIGQLWDYRLEELKLLNAGEKQCGNSVSVGPNYFYGNRYSADKSHGSGSGI